MIRQTMHDVANFKMGDIQKLKDSDTYHRTLVIILEDGSKTEIVLFTDKKSDIVPISM